MPTTAPVESTSGPPELPGLIAASVWIASITALASVSPASSRTGRSSALTMPSVTVPTRPSGEPMAITPSPTARLADDPIAATTGFATSTLTTARSVFGSRPTMRAAARVPSWKIASMPAPAAVRGRARRRGCWSARSRRGSMTTPDPVPPSSPTRISRDTTAGTVRAAMSATDPGGRSLPSATAGRSSAPGSVRSRGAVRRQPPDQPAGGPDEQRDQPERAPGPAAAPGGRTAPRAGSAGRPRPRAAACGLVAPAGGGPSATGLSGVAPRVRSAPDPERRIARLGSPDRRRAGAAATAPSRSGRPKAQASAAGGRRR